MKKNVKKGSRRNGGQARPISSDGVRPDGNGSRKPFLVVGIGASAGGLEAFEQFFSKVSSSSSSSSSSGGMAFVLISHLDPNHVSLLPDLLRRRTQLEVVSAEDRMVLRPGTVYVIPPNRQLAIFHGVLQMTEPSESRGLRTPIDFFFRSLAEDMGENAVGIILSGTGTDGTLGLRAIKAEYGMVMVQDPKSAQFDGMPRSAVDTGLADFVLPAQEMAGHLAGFARRVAHGTARAHPQQAGLPPEALQKIFHLIRSTTGHDFSLYKKNTLARRIERRMNLHQIDEVAHYVQYLDQNPGEVNALFKEFLIGVTSFFRDPEAFQALKKRFLPGLLKSLPKNHTVRVWVTACSGGEEVYSLAMLLKECMGDVKKTFKVQIFGTDIDPKAIDLARAGRYPASIDAEVSAARLARFFVREDGFYRVKKEIREMAVFATQSVLKDPPFTKLDMLSCRNLMIYIEGDAQKKLIPLFHYALRPGGLLFLGASESTGHFQDLFSLQDKKWKIFKRRDAAAAQSLMGIPRSMTTYPQTPPVETAKAVAEDVSKAVGRVLMGKYANPCVVINSKGDVLFIQGRAGKYLDLKPGVPVMNILGLARDDLKPALTAALRRAADGKPISASKLKLKSSTGVNPVTVSVRPFHEQGLPRDLMIVSFHESSRAKGAGRREASSSQAQHERLEAAEQELLDTRKDLHNTVGELETSNEELKSTNEELQSTNEEMETSKEELQSLNEELVTVNTELQGKIEDMTEINDDLRNLFDGTKIAMIFLDSTLRIKRFNSQMTKIIHLIPGDAGRPVDHVVSNLLYPDFVRDVKAVFDTLVPKETEVQSKDGHWYLMRILPYRAQGDRIAGIVVTFIGIDEMRAQEETIHKLNRDLQDARDYLDNIVQTIREALLVLDEDLRVVSANRSFYRLFKTAKDQTEGKFIYDLGNGEWNIPELKRLLEEVIPTNNAFENFRVDHVFPSIGPKKMILNARRVRQSSGDPLVLLAIEEVAGAEGGGK